MTPFAASPPLRAGEGAGGWGRFSAILSGACEALMFDPFNLTVSVVLSLIIIFGLLTTMAYMTWFERRVISRLQARIGPNKTGWEGLLQPLADAIKLFFKEDIRPVMSDRLLYVIAPAISLFAALAAFAVIPVGGTISLAGADIMLQVADLPVGVVYVLAAS